MDGKIRLHNIILTLHCCVSKVTKLINITKLLTKYDINSTVIDFLFQENRFMFRFTLACRIKQEFIKVHEENDLVNFKCAHECSYHTVYIVYINHQSNKCKLFHIHLNISRLLHFMYSQ